MSDLVYGLLLDIFQFYIPYSFISLWALNAPFRLGTWPFPHSLLTSYSSLWDPWLVVVLVPMFLAPGMAGIRGGERGVP